METGHASEAGGTKYEYAVRFGNCRELYELQTEARRLFLQLVGPGTQDIQRDQSSNYISTRGNFVCGRAEFARSVSVVLGEGEAVDEFARRQGADSEMAGPARAKCWD